MSVTFHSESMTGCEWNALGLMLSSDERTPCADVGLKHLFECWRFGGVYGDLQ